MSTLPSNTQSLIYIGDGAFRPGLPMRDLDQAEFASFDPDELAAGVAAGLYTAVGPAPEPDATAAPAPTKAELLTEAAARGIDVGKRPTNKQLSAAIAAFDKEQANPHTPTKAELLDQAAARGLDLGARPTNAAIEAEIAAFDKEQADAAGAAATEEVPA